MNSMNVCDDDALWLCKCILSVLFCHVGQKIVVSVHTRHFVVHICSWIWILNDVIFFYIFFECRDVYAMLAWMGFGLPKVQFSLWCSHFFVLFLFSVVDISWSRQNSHFEYFVIWLCACIDDEHDSFPRIIVPFVQRICSFSHHRQ